MRDWKPVGSDPSIYYLDSLQAKVDALKQSQAKTTTELDAMLSSVLDKAFKGELI